ncbi:MAG: hypothetical protein FVQ77_05930 [Cytophagales bacterium]|nr:hypothetical protein [Cytophagales bacterium]
MKDSEKIMNLPKQLFWDVDYEKIDYDKKRIFVIGRVLNFGTLDEIREVFKRYGVEEVKRCIVKATGLTERSENFWSRILDIPKENFRCYIRKQLNPVQWSY